MNQIIFRTRGLVSTHRTELIITVGLFTVALAMRLYNLMLIPRYEDEGVEVLWGLGIVRAGQLPLTAVVPYQGPLYPYLLAVFFWLAGVSIYLPRVTMAVFGALTVVAAYELGQVIWNRTAGLAAAALTITCPTLIVITSHFAYSNSLTPFFFTLCVLMLYVGLVKERGWLIALSGLCAGLALQTHPTSLFGLIGLPAVLLARRKLRRWLTTPWVYLAVGLFVLGYAPMILSGVRSSTQLVQAVQIRSYAFAPTVSLAVYVTRVAFLVQRQILLIAGWLPRMPLVGWVIVVAIGLLLGVGLLIEWQRKRGLIASVFFSTAVVMPLIVTVQNNLRYIAFLAPLAFVVIGGLVATIAENWTPPRWVPSGRHGVQVVAAILLAILSLYPLSMLSGYYNAMSASGRTNGAFFQLIDVLRMQGACGKNLYLLNMTFKDFGIEAADAWYTYNSIEYVLTLEGCDHQTAGAASIVKHLENAGGEGWLIIPKSMSGDFVSALELERMLIPWSDRSHLDPFVLYRVQGVVSSQSTSLAGEPSLKPK